MSVIKCCQEMFHFELPSITLQRRLEKIEIEHGNIETVLMKLVFSQKILCVCACIVLSMLCVYACFDSNYVLNKRQILWPRTSRVVYSMCQELTFLRCCPNRIRCQCPQNSNPSTDLINI